MQTEPEDRARRGARAFVAGFLTVFIVCGLFRIEAWPLGAFRLFSHVRHETQRVWVIRVADTAGREHPMPFGRLGVGYSGWVHIASGFGSLPLPERLGVCRAYLDGTAPIVESAAEIRFYREEQVLSRRSGERVVPGPRTLAYSCTRDAVVEGTP